MTWILILKNFPHKNDVTESLKSIQVTIDESRKRIDRMKARREFLEKVLAPIFYHNNDEYIKMISVTPIESLFINIKIDKK